MFTTTAPWNIPLDPGHDKGRPAMTSEAPEMNLVREWTTTSAPQRAGEMIMGLKVLSTTSFTPCATHNCLVQTVPLAGVFRELCSGRYNAAWPHMTAKREPWGLSVMLSLSRQGWCSKEYAGRTLLWAISAMAGRSATTRVGFDTASVKTTCTAQMLQGLNSHRLFHFHSHTCLQGVVQVLGAGVEHALVLLVIAA